MNPGEGKSCARMLLGCASYTTDAPDDPGWPVPPAPAVTPQPARTITAAKETPASAASMPSLENSLCAIRLAPFARYSAVLPVPRWPMTARHSPLRGKLGTPGTARYDGAALTKVPPRERTERIYASTRMVTVTSG